MNIPPEVKHWHGAAPDRWFSHLAVEVPGEGASNEWCELVAEEAMGHCGNIFHNNSNDTLT